MIDPAPGIIDRECARYEKTCSLAALCGFALITGRCGASRDCTYPGLRSSIHIHHHKNFFPRPFSTLFSLPGTRMALARH